MSEPPLNDPLLSAYLDGALDQEQAKLVEKRFADNPGLQAIVHAWKEQGNAIRALPIHQLRGDLSQAVLQEVNRRRISGELPDLSSAKVGEDQFEADARRHAGKRNWRASLVAISCLAGLILAGFFLLRPDQIEIAYKDSNLPVSRASNSDESDRMDAPGQPTAEDPLFGFRDSSKEERQVKSSQGINPGSMPEAPSMSEDLDTASAEKADGLSKNSPEREFAAADLFKKEFKNETLSRDLADPKSPETMKSAGRSSSGEARSELEALADAGFGGMAEEQGLDQADKRRPLNDKGISGQTVSIPQVYFVEFTSREQPLALISEIFSRNQIEIRLPDDLAHLGEKGSTDVMTMLATRSRNGLEAIYVIATRSQLKRAMAELSNSANISGFEVSSSILEKMLGPTIAENEVMGRSTEPRMDDMIVELKSNRSMHRARLEEKTNRGSAEESKLPLSPPKRFPAFALQLQPVERMQRTPPGIASEQLEPLKAKESTDSLDLLFQSKTMWINWDYLRPENRVPALNLGEAGKKQAAASLDGELAEQIDQEEFVQFLLLVRTTRPE